MLHRIVSLLHVSYYSNVQYKLKILIWLVLQYSILSIWANILFWLPLQFRDAFRLLGVLFDVAARVGSVIRRSPSLWSSSLFFFLRETSVFSYSRCHGPRFDSSRWSTWSLCRKRGKRKRWERTKEQEEKEKTTKCRNVGKCSRRIPEKDELLQIAFGTVERKRILFFSDEQRKSFAVLLTRRHAQLYDNTLPLTYARDSSKRASEVTISKLEKSALKAKPCFLSECRMYPRCARFPRVSMVKVRRTVWTARGYLWKYGALLRFGLHTLYLDHRLR